MFKTLFFKILPVFWVVVFVSVAAFASPSIPTDYSVYPHLDRVEYLDGETFAVEAFSLWGNDHFAVANEVSGLNIYRIDGDQVVHIGVGGALGSERDVVVDGWLAYVATGSQGLSQMSLAVPEAPFETAAVDLPGTATRVEVSATHAFVACGTGGLAIVDITQSGALYLVGSYGNEVTAVSLDGTRLAIVNDGRVEILDVSIPAVPVHLGTYVPDNGATNYINAAILGNVAYAGSTGQVERLDVSDPMAITATDVFDLNGPYHLYGSRLEVEGAELLVAGAGYLGILDFASGTILRETKQVGDIADAAIIAGKVAAITDERLEIYQDGLHANAEPVGVFNYGGIMSIKGILEEDILFGQAITSNPILVAMEIGGDGETLWTLDLEMPGGGFRDHASLGSTIVVLNSSGMLRVVNASRYGAVLRGSLVLPDFLVASSYQALAFLDASTLVVLDKGPDELPFAIRVVDISDPDLPAQIESYPLTIPYASGVLVAGSLVMGAGGDRVEIFDATDRTSLQFLDVFMIGDYSSRILARDSYLYTMHQGASNTLFGSEYLTTWDISNPLNPLATDRRAMAKASELVLEGNWAYQKSTGLILDLSDPAHPAPAGNFSLPNPSVNQNTDVVASREYIVTGWFGNSTNGFVHFLPAHLGTGEISAVEQEIPAVGPELVLQAVPNPFNPRVTFQFDLPVASHTQLEIYDLRGRLVADLGSRLREAGPHRVVWEGKDAGGRNLPSGVYLARISTFEGSASKKIVLAR